MHHPHNTIPGFVFFFFSNSLTTDSENTDPHTYTSKFFILLTKSLSLLERKVPFYWQALTFYNCKNVKANNLKIQNGQQIHVSFEKCVNVQASNLKVTAPENSPNTDGIHVTNTQNIQISSCVIGTGISHNQKGKFHFVSTLKTIKIFGNLKYFFFWLSFENGIFWRKISRNKHGNFNQAHKKLHQAHASPTYFEFFKWIIKIMIV